MSVDRLSPRAQANIAVQPGEQRNTAQASISEGKGDALQEALRDAPPNPDGGTLAGALHSAGILPEAKNDAQQAQFEQAASRAFKSAGIQVGEPITPAQRETLGSTLEANGVPINND